MVSESAYYSLGEVTWSLSLHRRSHVVMSQVSGRPRHVILRARP